MYMYTAICTIVSTIFARFSSEVKITYKLAFIHVNVSTGLLVYVFTTKYMLYLQSINDNEHLLLYKHTVLLLSSTGFSSCGDIGR